MLIHFIRHGQSQANLSRDVIQGQFDSPLSELGKQQASDLTRQLDFNFDKVYSSPLLRAKQTALISLQGLGWDSDQLLVEQDLREIGMGNYEGLTFDELGINKEELRPIVFLENDVHLDKHQGETITDFKDRTVKVFHKIVKKEMGLKSKSIIIYSHGGVMRSILKKHLNIYDGPYYNVQIVSIQLINDTWQIINGTKNFSP